MELYTLVDHGGYKSPDEAILAHLDLLAADGSFERSRYIEALSSTSGPSRFESGTGKLIVDGKVQAQLVRTQLADGTWRISSITLCMQAVPPDVMSPYPTPDADRS